MSHKEYFLNTVSELLKGLKSSTPPSFGLMTAQHMVEHLVKTAKVSIVDNGPAPEELTERQLGFMKFVKNGANLSYKPSDKTVADLPELKYPNLDEAINAMPAAIERMYAVIDEKKKSDGYFYAAWMGKLTPSEFELFHHKHFEWHLEKQFGLALPTS